METISLDKWSVDTEPDLTREAYALLECGGAEDCGCEACFNFATTRHLVYGSELLEFLEWLGIDPLLEAHVRYVARHDSGDHVYGVSFFLVGQIASGPATPVARRSDMLCESLEPAGNAYVGFSADVSEAPEVFRGLPCVKLELRVVAPWVSNAPEPAVSA